MLTETLCRTSSRRSLRHARRPLCNCAWSHCVATGFVYYRLRAKLGQDSDSPLPPNVCHTGLVLSWVDTLDVDLDDSRHSCI